MNINSINGEYRPTAEFSPGEEFARMVGVKIEVHVRAGHWHLAATVLREAHAEWLLEVEEHRRRLARSPAEWLERPIGELGLLVRTENAMEKAGCVTIRDALDWLNSGQRQGNFGPVSTEEVWTAARALGITIERREVVPEVHHKLRRIENSNAKGIGDASLESKRE